MKTKSMLLKLAKQFPKKIAKKHHDFVGVMVGPLPEEVHKIVLCLDFDEQILNDVLEFKPDLIITHHPFFFGSKTKILKYDEKKSYLNEVLTKNKIALYSMHTNFDEGRGGMNDVLAKLLNLTSVYAPDKDQMMRIGVLENEQSIEDFGQFVKNSLNVDYALLVQNGPSKIKKVGIIGGGGSRSFTIAKEEGCDIYISGDAPHYVRRDVVLNNFNYLDIPHEVERVFMPAMKGILQNMDADLDIIILDHELMPKVIK